ncbi:MAG: iron-sulfur cluster assembly accessory protein [Pseudomonadota bacterium]|jgi:iron-sulfur cluster assembly protein|nr:iron-sulfur cluster assembly accessory protein [Pseudomonadota bacterium]
MTISLTQAAIDRIKDYANFDSGEVCVRVGVKKTGCNGYAYVINYTDKIDNNDKVFKDNGIKLVVDKMSLELIDGTEVDFSKDGLNEAFRFRNPNISSECGCGESFSI